MVGLCLTEPPRALDTYEKPSRSCAATPDLDKQPMPQLRCLELEGLFFNSVAMLMRADR